MAECQVPYAYSADIIAKLRETISEKRFQRYLTAAGGNEADAVGLYLWNGRIAKALLFPLSVVEVTVRNAVNASLVKIYGEEWYFSPDARAALHTKSVDAIDRALTKLQSSEQSRIVAELSFDFWTRLFQVRYAEFWRTQINITFPGLKHGESRWMIKELADDVNDLRNRVAHHEPVFQLDLPKICDQMYELVSLRSAATANWMKAHMTVALAVQTRPGAAAAPPQEFISRIDQKFRSAAPDSTVAQLLAQATQQLLPVVVEDQGQILGAFSPQQLSQYMLAESLNFGGYLDLNDIHMSQLIAAPLIKDSWATLEVSAPMSEVVTILQKPKIRIVVGTDPSSNAVIGALMKAHRRY